MLADAARSFAAGVLIQKLVETCCLEPVQFAEGGWGAQVLVGRPSGGGVGGLCYLHPAGLGELSLGKGWHNQVHQAVVDEDACGDGVEDALAGQCGLAGTVVGGAQSNADRHAHGGHLRASHSVL